MITLVIRGNWAVGHLATCSKNRPTPLLVRARLLILLLVLQPRDEVLGRCDYRWNCCGGGVRAPLSCLICRANEIVAALWWWLPGVNNNIILPSKITIKPTSAVTLSWSHVTTGDHVTTSTWALDWPDPKEGERDTGSSFTKTGDWGSGWSVGISYRSSAPVSNIHLHNHLIILMIFVGKLVHHISL